MAKPNGDEWHKLSQRTVKCPRCKVRRFYVYENGDGATELRDAQTGDKHTCTAKARTAPQAAATPAAPIMRGTDDELAAMAKLIPEKRNLDSYVPRMLDTGRTDVDTLVNAYRQNQAHANGTCLKDLCVKDCKREPVNVLIISETGAGKNHLERAVAYKLGIPYVRFNFNAGTTIDSMVGKIALPEAGRTVWQDGLLTLGGRHGAMICLDELNACPNEIAVVLHPLLDAERLAILADKPEYFRISPNTFFVANMNPDYAGTRPLNGALRSRFNLTITLDYDPDVEKRLVKDEKLRKLAANLRDVYRTGDGTIMTPISTRLLIAYEANRAAHGEKIARESFLSTFDTKEERAAVREAFLTFMETGAAGDIDVDKDVNLDA